MIELPRSRALLNVLSLVDDEAGELPVEKQFLRDLKASVEMTDAKNQRKPSKTFKPSSLHCIRNMYFQVMGAPISEDSASCELIGICESGTDRHERIQQYVCDMKSNNIDCEYVDVAEYVRQHNLGYLDVVSKNGYETKLFYKDLNMRFLCDGIIRYKGRYYILEIKTETANKFWDRKGVNPDHILQGTAYSLAFGIEDVLFVYECRDNCSKKAFMLHVTDDMRDALRQKIFNCMGYISRQIVPPKPEDVSRKMCAYCGYADICKRS